MADSKQFKVGDKVRVLAGIPDGRILSGTVKVVNDPKDNPGQQIGVELDEPIEYGHSLELVLPREVVNPVTNRTVGRGWWAHPEDLDLV